ncbi:MAG: hypothetical protein N2651_08675, partial [Fimbriimonadales bacterium]|nr:hypothetical protein [Fimbriimonadales bacterium]
EIAAQVARRSQIDFSPAEQLCEFPLQASNAQQARNMSFLELYQQIDVALGVKVAVKGRAEQREFSDMLLPAKLA